jgi:hypothetical protein
MTFVAALYNVYLIEQALKKEKKNIKEAGKSSQAMPTIKEENEVKKEEKKEEKVEPVTRVPATRGSPRARAPSIERVTPSGNEQVDTPKGDTPQEAGKTTPRGSPRVARKTSVSPRVEKTETEAPEEEKKTEEKPEEKVEMKTTPRGRASPRGSPRASPRGSPSNNEENQKKEEEEKGEMNVGLDQ